MSWSRSLALALALALGSAAAACRGQPATRASGDAGPGAAPSAAGAPSPAAPSLAGIGMLGSMLAAQADEPGPYDDPRHSAHYDEKKAHAAVIDLDDPIVEVKALSLFGGGSGIELRALSHRLDELALASEVTSLVLRFDGVELDYPMAEELRAQIEGFRAVAAPGAGKSKHVAVHCYAEAPTDVVYYVMTACDSIGIAPLGLVVVSGVAAVPIHVKGALDRLGVQADFLHVGAFKGAAEPLTRDRPSPEMVKTLDAILDERYAVLVEGIATGRHLEPARVRALIDTAVFPAEQAVQAGLADAVGPFASWRDQVLTGSEWSIVKVSDDDKLGMGKLMEMLGVVPRRRPSHPRLALVYAVGSVVDGEGGGAIAARREIAPRTLGPALRTLAADDSVKAVVLRIDSGGGSAMASEILWQAVADLRKKKPVVVSMGDVAASGGYYIGCGADRVFASRTTLTGSIGVVGGKLAIGRTLGKLGVVGFPMARGKRALLFSSLAPWTSDERAAVQQSMQRVYDTFVSRVSDGRHKSLADVQSIAQGRVWTGAAARERGLVDEIGGLGAAIQAARKRANVPDSAELEVYPPPPTLMDFLGSIGEVSSGMPFGLDAAALSAQADHVAPRELRVIRQVLELVASFGATHVQTALVLPILLR